MKKKSKKSVVIGIIILFLVTLILLGLTYAYYRTRIVGNEEEKSISVTSKKLEVTYSDDKAVIEASDIEPGYTATKTFSVENTGSEPTNFGIVLDNVENTFTRKSDWTFVLKQGETVIREGIVPSQTSYIANTLSIEPDETIEYTLTINYANLKDVNQSEDMGNSLSLRVNIDNETGAILESAEDGTLLAAIRDDNLISEPLTVPGREVSLVNEAELAATADDYGTSYYFRGNVENNYVNYSGMCFRIVRVLGNGIIKLTLADRDNLCNSESYGTKDNAPFADVSVHKNITNDIDYWMAQNPYKLTPEHLDSDLLYETSDIPSLLNIWATKEIVDSEGNVIRSANLDTSSLINSYWCNDMAQTSERSLNEDWEIIDDPNSSDLFEIQKIYAGADRLYTVDENGSYVIANANPSLKCNSVGVDGGSESVKYENNIGILTADEVAFAGGAVSLSNDNYFLKTTNAYYWTMTPVYFDALSDKLIEEGLTNDGYIFAVNGGNIESHVVKYLSDHYIRPVITINKTTTILDGGNGTQNNPYVIG